MTESAKLSGTKFKNGKNIDFLYFTNDNFNQWFKMKEKDVKVLINSLMLKTDDSNFSIDIDITFDGTNTHLLLRQKEKFIVYSWTEPNGPHPLRWESRDDLTDFFNSLKKY